MLTYILWMLTNLWHVVLTWNSSTLQITWPQTLLVVIVKYIQSHINSASSLSHFIASLSYCFPSINYICVYCIQYFFLTAACLPVAFVVAATHTHLHTGLLRVCPLSAYSDYDLSDSLKGFFQFAWNAYLAVKFSLLQPVRWSSVRRHHFFCPLHCCSLD